MSKDKTSIVVWGITGVLALCMIGAAVYISMNNRQTAQTETAPPPVTIAKQQPREPAGRPPEPVSQPERGEQQEPPQPRTAREPAPQPPQEQPSQTQPVPDREGAAIPEETAALDLSAIAGNMTASTKLVGADGDKIPLRHTCYRHNYSPAISIEGAPADTRSYVVFLEKNNDGEDNVLHWALFNVPPETTMIAENIPRQPEYNGMRHGDNDFGNAEYAGPCDPKGRQNYRIRVFALDRELDQPASVARTELVRAMNGHIIDMAEIDIIHYNKL